MKTKTDSQKKYWWLVVLVLPVILALIAVIPSLGKKEDKAAGGTTISQTGTGNAAQSGTGNIQQSGGVNILNSDLSTKMYVANISIITQQYERAQGQPLTNGELKQQIERALAEGAAGQHAESVRLFEALAAKIPLPAIYNNLGTEYAKAGNNEAARKSFSSAIEKDPGYAGASLNRGLVAVAQGKLNEALPDLQNASGMDEAKQVVAAIQQELKKDVHSLEIEPNQDLFHANLIPLDVKIQATISESSDVDSFQFTTPSACRDLIQIGIENRSTTLAPGVIAFDANKSQLPGAIYNDTKGANLEYTFSAPPNTTCYLQIYGRYSSGDYTLTVRPLKKYDAYEPNEDILHPTAVSLGTPINANIMDSQDADYYQFKTAANSGKVKVSVVNRSTTLAPGITVYDANKSQLGGSDYNDTKGADFAHTFSAQPNTTYYVQIYGRYSSGDYTLTLTQE